MKIIKMIHILGLILNGFTYKTAKEYLYFKKVYANGKRDRYSIKDIMSILPINKTFDKMFDDLLSMKMLLEKYDGNLLRYYYIALERDDKRIFCPIDARESFSIEHIIDLLVKEGSICIKKASGLINSREYICQYKEKSFFINNEEVEKQYLIDKIMTLPKNYIIMQHIDGESIELSTINENGIEPNIADKRERLGDGIETISLNIAKDFPEIEYMHFTFVKKDNDIFLIKIETGVDLVRETEFLSDKDKYINQKIQTRIKNKRSFIDTIKRYIFSYIAGKKGFVDYMYRNWRRGKREDKKTRSVTRKEMRWAHKRGFYSYRIAQYGLTEENYHDFLSDYDYKRMRPINNEYRKWLWDKLTFYYILRKYQEYLPEYYYHIFPKNGKVLVLGKGKMMGNESAEIRDIIRLLIKKGKLALKPTIASHGEGFYKLEYVNDNFLINDDVISEVKLEQFLASLRTYYLVSEYVEMNCNLKKIYPNVASTIRFMVINRDSYTPVIEDAYFRIGTSKTGQTDNIAAGGVFAHIDKKTGKFKNAQIIEKHIISSCSLHPDTNVKIEGKIPFWEEICKKIIEISKYISPIEYMGFDVVVTDNSFRILEINTHQDLHRYPEYGDDVKEYFKHKQMTIK